MINLSDIAILVRSTMLTRVIESALTREGLPYMMVGGMRFFDRVEVRNVLDYLRTIYNPTNNDVLERIINIPPRKIGDTTVKALLADCHRKKTSLWSGIANGIAIKVPKQAEQNISTFVGIIKKAQRMLLRKRPYITFSRSIYGFF